MTARLSVRTVAFRAGVSTGSLRHHFPTQQALRNAVLGRIYDWTVTGAEDIRDATRPARDHLVDCLRSVLDAAPIGQPAREAVMTLTRDFITADPTDQIRGAYLAMEQDGQHRVEDWLTVLARERDVSTDDVPRQARFLNTVLEGLALQRALPADDAIVQMETATLYLAADAVLHGTTEPG